MIFLMPFNKCQIGLIKKNAGVLKHGRGEKERSIITVKLNRSNGGIYPLAVSIHQTQSSIRSRNLAQQQQRIAMEVALHFSLNTQLSCNNYWPKRPQK